MHFGLTDEQEQLRKEVRAFAEREIAPHVNEWDEKSEFPHEVVKKLGEMGLMGVIFPEELGGAGMGYVEYVLAVEELSRVDGSVGIIVASHNSLCTNHIMLAGNDEQRKRWVPKLASGEWLGAWGLTEPGSGIGCGRDADDCGAAGDGWVLNGSKTFITNGTYANCALVLAVTDKEKGTSGGISAFVVEQGTKGFRSGKKENKLGLRASDTAELIFEDCEIPAENLVGKEGDGFKDAMRVLDGGRISIAALALGMARGALDAAVKYAQGAASSLARRSVSFRRSSSSWPTWRRSWTRRGCLTMRAAQMKDAGQAGDAESAHGEAVSRARRRAGFAMRGCRFMAAMGSSRTTRRRSFTAM